MDDNTKKYLKLISEKKNYKKILEIGSLDVNGEIRSIFKDYDLYHGIDIHSGKNVDIVGHFASKEVQDSIEDFYDLVICCNVMEHDKEWRHTFENVLNRVKKGGIAVIIQPTTISLNNFFHINSQDSIVEFKTSWENERVKYRSEYFENGVSDDVLKSLAPTFLEMANKSNDNRGGFNVTSKHISYPCSYYISHNVHYTKNGDYYANVKLGEILEIMAVKNKINEFHIDVDLNIDCGLQYNITLTRH